MGVTVAVDASIYRSDATVIADLLRDGSGYSVAINAEKILGAKESADLNRVISNAKLPYLDGEPIARLLRIAGHAHVRTLNLPVKVLHLVAEHHLTLAIVGGHESIQRRLAGVLRRSYPAVDVLFLKHGFLPYNKVKELVVRVQPDILLLGVGSPKQEFIAANLLRDGYQGFTVPCGGALDVLVGHKKRAPRVLQRLGIEAPFRLLQDPRRWRRYLKLVPFAFRLLAAYAYALVGIQRWKNF